ncbi:Mitochondrial copper homeostasis protein [Coemansia sp. S155-1]|nr:Mitochondrial copper homeostasis protein [Coemansia sp. S155-1]
MSDTTSQIRSSSQEKDPRRITLKEFQNKQPSKFLDPCAIERRNSYKCLEENYYDGEACREMFEDYRECKKMWLAERARARRAGEL